MRKWVRFRVPSECLPFSVQRLLASVAGAGKGTISAINVQGRLLFQAEFRGWSLYLVGGLEHFVLFHILGIIIPTDVHIFQRGWNHQPAMVFPRNMGIDCIDIYRPILFTMTFGGVSWKSRAGRLPWHRTVSPKRKQRKRKKPRAKNTRLENWEQISLANNLAMAVAHPDCKILILSWVESICSVMSLQLHSLEIAGSSEGQRKRKRRRGLRRFVSPQLSQNIPNSVSATTSMDLEAPRFRVRTAMQAAKEERMWKRPLAANPCCPCWLLLNLLLPNQLVTVPDTFWNT